MHGQELINAVAPYSSIRAAARDLGIPESTIRNRLKKVEAEGAEDGPPPIPDYAFKPADDHLPASHVGAEGVTTQDYWQDQQRDGATVKRYILTSAQNNVRVHEGFLRNLKALASQIGAELLVSFSVYDKAGYRGPVPKGEKKRGTRDIWWDKAVEPYVINHRARLAKRLEFCGELDILATARHPLSGLDSYCGRSSFIVPHNKFEFRCVESRRKHLPKEMFTTGSVTEPSFIQRKTGQVASFHHVLGALMVEVRDDGYWYTHHLNAEDDGSFYWLNTRVENGRAWEHNGGVAGMILGDIHFEKKDPAVWEETWDILYALRPKHVVLHDLIDFTSRNHHNRKDPEHAAFYMGAVQTVADELRQAGRLLRELANEVPAVTVVPSNHHDAMRKWLHETDWRHDPINADLYLAAAREMVYWSNRFGPGTFKPLEWAIRDYHEIDLPDQVVFLNQDESLEIADVECGMHGHVGPSGSRGSPSNIARLPFKTFTGHTHSPSIKDGCYTVGLTADLDLGYNQGPSKWMHAHGIIYPNGKRAFIFIKNGRWRG